MKRLQGWREGEGQERGRHLALPLGGTRRGEASTYHPTEGGFGLAWRIPSLGGLEGGGWAAHLEGLAPIGRCAIGMRCSVRKGGSREGRAK